MGGASRKGHSARGAGLGASPLTDEQLQEEAHKVRAVMVLFTACLSRSFSHGLFLA